MVTTLKQIHLVDTSRSPKGDDESKEVELDKFKEAQLRYGIDEQV